MKNGVTLQDIADKTHVSKALVSRVLNNREVRVSVQKREQILETANEMGYLSNSQILSSGSSPSLNKTIALLLSNINSTFMSTIADAVTSHSYHNGYSTLLFDYHQDSSMEARYLELCHSLGVSGVILDSITSVKSNENSIKKMGGWDLPIVYLDCYPNSDESLIVASTNKESMYRLTESMIARGHKNILSVIQDRSTYTNVSMNRLNGYYEAMDQHGLRGYNEIIYPDRSLDQQPIFYLLNSETNFSAFIIHTGSDIHGFCEMIHNTRYAERHDYELAVFDDFYINYRDYMSGVNQDVYSRIVCNMAQRPKEMAAKAVDMVIDKIKKGDSYPPQKVFIDCDLTFANDAASQNISEPQ